ncbi:MAG: hypothetical protein DRI79_07350 [Chloroflexi bacterium]|nr:MAG: hypothetical protein DRI80_18625 [Chloroflexota bacterium]RLC89197.1 MAG: hypothetical protein DRI79_07350 [Chloroflexota bacterium]
MPRRDQNTHWRDAVLDALHRFSNRHNTKTITRQGLLEEELDRIVSETGTRGLTPEQTLSRVLQELRDEGILYFIGGGQYLLLMDTPIDVEMEELPRDAIDFAIRRGKLRIGMVPARDELTMSRRRLGQSRIRWLCLHSYDHQCALCDIRNENLLIASHISRWADDPEARGVLSNVICFCRFHDVLFEYGYISLSDDYHVLKKGNVNSQTVARILDITNEFRLPKAYPPAPEFLQKHRVRTGFERC